MLAMMSSRVDGHTARPDRNGRLQGRTNTPDKRSTGRRIDKQPLDDFTPDQVPIDNLIEVFLVDIGVPNRFGIHDDNGAELAAIEAAGRVDSDTPGAAEPKLLAPLLDVGARVLGVALATGLATVFAYVGAEKHVV
jgi:hypothetical protein